MQWADAAGLSEILQPALHRVEADDLGQLPQHRSVPFLDAGTDGVIRAPSGLLQVLEVRASFCTALAIGRPPRTLAVPATRRACCKTLRGAHRTREGSTPPRRRRRSTSKRSRSFRIPHVSQQAHLSRIYFAAKPASTGSVTPVTYRASSETNQAIALLTSLASISSTGIRFDRDWATSGF